MSYNCSLCKKNYKSYQSIWNHNNKFHKDIVIMIPQKDNKTRKFHCSNCNKKFTRKGSMLYHLDTACKNKKEQPLPKNILNDKIDKLEKQISELQESMKKTTFDNTKNTENNKTLCKNNTCNYIYLIEKFDVNNNISIYKFGKTNRPILDRIKEHCLTSKVLFILEVSDCDISENNILKILNNDIKITRNKDIGNEYFCCDDKEYIVNTVLKNLIK